MDFTTYFEARFSGDDFDGHYTSGLTLTGGSTTQKLLSNKNGDDGLGHKFTLHSRTTDSCCTIFSTTLNCGKDDTLEMISAFAVKDLHFDKIYRLQSFWSEECALKTDTLDSLQLNPSWNPNGIHIEKFYNTSSAPNKKFHPFICLENAASSDFFAVMLGGGTPWQIELFWRAGSYHLVCGPADADVGHWKKNLKKGESFTTSEVYTAHGKSLEEVCDKIVKAQKPNYSRIDDGMPLIFNEYCTTWGNPSEENILKILSTLKSRSKAVPIKYLVIDAGWYKENEQWWSDQGNWNVNKSIFPNGIKSVSEKIREAGLIPGILVELEIA